METQTLGNSAALQELRETFHLQLGAIKVNPDLYNTDFSFAFMLGLENKIRGAAGFAAAGGVSDDKYEPLLRLLQPGADLLDILPKAILLVDLLLAKSNGQQLPTSVENSGQESVVENGSTDAGAAIEPADPTRQEPTRRKGKWALFYEVVDEWRAKEGRFPLNDGSKKADQEAKELGRLYHERIASEPLRGNLKEWPRFQVKIQGKKSRSAEYFVRMQVKNHPDFKSKATTISKVAN